ncbi:MAG: tetratricopeptide repeat protein [Acidobacteria bacterium]|nr:tetratricopeptide repeat protein [Acidobacteriota bacterium]
MSSEIFLHIKLIELGNGLAELRYFFNNPNAYQSRQLKLAALEPLITTAETDYYTVRPADLEQTGQKLFNWLDEADRFLARAIAKTPVNQLLVLAISTTGKLGHLPWETLHDGKSFLVESQSPRIVPVRWTDKTATGYAPANRPLRVLFMATSPQDSTSPLDFEREEALILDATSKKPLILTVEESGNLGELHETMTAFPADELDVFHLTGHATHTKDGPQFLMESDIGTTELATGAKIAQALHHKPKLVFLSGCKTGQAMKAGDVPSMAETLLNHGFTAVLGWGRSVLETDASQAAAALYHELSAGESPTHAVSATYKKLIEEKARDWHLLRLYVVGGIPQPLVTPLKTKGRKAAVPASVATRFLDADHKIKVPKREDFVGRRRVLQRCLKVLKYETDKRGVVLHGTNGLGKSSLAARMCDRLHEEFTLVAWFGKIDQRSLVNKLSEHIQNKGLRDTLLDQGTELKFKLWPVFEQIEKPFLLVLDDFEQNFEMTNGTLNWRDGLPVLSVDAVDILKALAFAIDKTNGRHRVIVTSRYEFAIEEASQFHVEPALDGLRDADWRKKIRRLEAGKTIPDALKGARDHAICVADGNPRLLEWLFKLLTTPGPDLTAILAEMDKKEAEFRESILAAELLKQQSPVLRQVLARAVVFDHPVPSAAITAICDDLSTVDQHLERAAALGLIEITLFPGDEPFYRVPRILLPLLKPEQPADQKDLCQKATAALYQFWWKSDKGVTEPQALEIHRLAIAGQEKEIAVKLAISLSRNWVNASRFQEAVSLCETTLNLVPDAFPILHSLARAEATLGNVEEALTHYQTALRNCPAEEFKEKSAILHNSANLERTQGRIEEALAFNHQSLEFNERSGNVLGKAATLHQMAGLFAQQGRVAEALDLYHQSLELQERIKDVLGQAATLHQMAGLFAQQGRVEEALALYHQSLKLKERIDDVQGKAITMAMMAQLLAQKGEFQTAIVYLQESQAILRQIKSPDAEQVGRTLMRIVWKRLKPCTVKRKCGNLSRPWNRVMVKRSRRYLTW